MSNKTGKKGGQFNNINAEKWTEKKAIKIGEELIKWMQPNVIATEWDKNKKPTKYQDVHSLNIFFMEFLVMKKGLYKDIIYHLQKRFPSFSEYIKRAKSIQEIKLNKYGVLNKLSPALTIFLLKHHHKYSDLAKIEHSGNISNESRLESQLKEMFDKHGEEKLDDFFKSLD